MREARDTNDRELAAELRDEAERAHTRTLLLYGGGAVAVLTGVALLWYAPSEGDGVDRRVEFGVGSRAFHVQLRW